MSYILKKERLPRAASNNAATGLGWLLWILLATTPWLIPSHTNPNPAFYSELLMASVVAIAWVWGGLSSKKKWFISYLTIACLGSAAVPIAQAVAGLIIFPNDAFLIAAVIIAFAASISLGQHAEQISPSRLIDSLYASLAIASIFSTGLALYQWLSLDMLGVMVPSMEIGGNRVMANVGQPNNLSTLIVWGLLALWWGYSRGAMGGIGAIVGAAFLLMGIAVTGSRTGWIQVAFLLVAGLFKYHGKNNKKQLVSILLLATWFAGLVVSLPILSNVMWGAASRSASELFTTGLRSKFWQMAIEGVVERPLFGYGWNQTVLVHVDLASKFPHLGEAMGHAHNIILDILLWNGIILGTIIIGYVIWWTIKQIKSVSTDAHYLLLVSLAVFLIHAMLELPHVYTFFILPVGLMLGTASAWTPDSVVIKVPRAAMGILGFIFVAVLLAMFIDYRNIESNFLAHRMAAARISGAEIPARPKLYILEPLQTTLEIFRIKPVAHMTPSELDALRRATIRYPTSGAPFRYVKASALNSRPEDAQWALTLICDMRPAADCDAATTDWQKTTSK
ncbi:O-antigen ligase C-terminal domain-containing protein [Rhodoferax sp. 4810]|nr:O-antigen ligase C-terminal domain-containing protein [Rhodoferax jenense]